MANLEALLKKYKDVLEIASVDRQRTWFSLGPLSLNLAVGNPKGVKSGRIIQIVGKYSSGKSTLALDIIAQHQKETGLKVLYVDFERAFDFEYARAVGVDTDNLLLLRADSTEQGLTVTESVIKSGEIKLAVIDSIAAAKPSSENEKDYDDNAKMASSAGIITRFCNRVIPLLDNYDVLLVVLNQLRANFNTLSPEKEVPFGGKSLHYATSVMIQTTNVKNTEDNTDIRAVIKKNKVGAPRHIAEFSITYGKGIDHAQDVINLGIEREIVSKNGAWFYFNNTKAQGMQNACNEFPIAEIRNLILKMEQQDDD